MLHRIWLKFKGLEACILLQVDAEFTESLNIVFAHWPFQLLQTPAQNSFADITLSQGKYTISSPFMAAPEHFKDPVNTICRLVVELAWAQLRERPELLCLHGAAVEMSGRLVVLPSTRRAGKSTLSLAMMAAGMKVFTDDFLPLEVAADNVIHGLSQGIATRLRHPLPDQAGPRTKAYFDARKHVENRQYRYIAAEPGNAARIGDAAPIGALVFLEQQPGCAPDLRPIAKSEALTALVRQNFSRAMNATAILKVLAAIVEGAPAYRLSYDQVEPAIDTLRAQFDRPESWPAAAAKVDAHAPREAPAAEAQMLPANWPDLALIRRQDVSEVSLEGKRYLAGGNDRNIIYLNESAAAIWQLLSQPSTLADIVELLAAAFPEQDPARLTDDVTATLQAFAGNQLVEVADSGECHG